MQRIMSAALFRFYVQSHDYPSGVSLPNGNDAWELRAVRRLASRICETAETMVLLEGIELSTSPLPRECSTTELQQRNRRLMAAL